jgi:arylsulfatase A
MKIILILSLIACCLPLHAKVSAKPNIVILYADDMGFGDLGANNPQSKIPTPHLDQLAKEGMRFTNGHSSSGICTPSRYAMLTGRYHWREFHGIAGAFDGTVFQKDQLTMPAMLRQQGYATACIGKWHLGFDWDGIRKPGAKKNTIEFSDYDWSKPFKGGPLDHGFDTYFGDNVINFPPYAWIENDRLVKAPDTTFRNNPTHPKEGNWECRPGPGVKDWDFYAVLPTLTEKGVDYIKARKGNKQPFFLYFPFPSPHAPIIPNDSFDGKSKAGAFGDFVTQTDDSCGKILQALRDNGFAENTIVVFSADNGAEHYAYARDQKFDHWSSGPFRGLKRDIYEGGHRVPFIIRWPGVLQLGAVSDALIAQIDLMATFANVTKFSLPKGAALDSHDFAPWMEKKSTDSPRRSMVHNTNPKNYAVRVGDWVLVNAKHGFGGQAAPKPWIAKHKIPADDGLPVELYDLKNDPGQRINLAAKHPEKVTELQAELKRIRESDS